MIDKLKSRWEKTKLSDDLFEKIVEAYSEPHRHYHTLQHIEECFSVLDEVFKKALISAELAIWFHDIVYDTKESDNELKSSEFAIDALSGTHLKGKGKMVKELIMGMQPPANHAISVVVDVDLAILGSAPKRFVEYEEQVRKEYEWVPEEIFVLKRNEILKNFADKVFWTKEMRNSIYQKRLKDNLDVALL